MVTQPQPSAVGSCPRPHPWPGAPPGMGHGRLLWAVLLTARESVCLPASTCLSCTVVSKNETPKSFGSASTDPERFLWIKVWWWQKRKQGHYLLHDGQLMGQAYFDLHCDVSEVRHRWPCAGSSADGASPNCPYCMRCCGGNCFDLNTFLQQ